MRWTASDVVSVGAALVACAVGGCGSTRSPGFGNAEDGGVEAGGVPHCSAYTVSPLIGFAESTTRADWAGPAYAIAYTGGRYVAIWSLSHPTAGEDAGASDPSFDIEVMATDRQGGVVFRRTALTAVAGSATVRAVEATPDGVGVVWCERPPGALPRLVFTRLTAEAALVAPPVELGGCDPQDPAALAWNGAGFGVAWGCARETLCVASLSERGELTAGAGMPNLRIAVRGVFGVIRMLWDRDRYALAWNETDPTYGANRFVVISPDAAPIGLVANLSDPAAYALSVYLARAQRGFALAWATSDGSELLEVDRVGTPISSPRPFPLAVPGALVYAGDEHAALFARPTLTDTEASYGFATLDLAGHLISDEAPVSPRELVQRISLHFDGSGFGVFSAEGGDSRLFFRRIECSEPMQATAPSFL